MSRTPTIARYFLPMSLGFVLVLAAGLAQADPLPGRDVLKFSQRPLDGLAIDDGSGVTTQYWGHDELSTAYGAVDATGQVVYQGQFMADDFADTFDSPVVHVKWWGSYLEQTDNMLPVDRFLISFESDKSAADAGGFSQPDTPLLSQIVDRGALFAGSGTFTEKLISSGGPPLDEQLYEYNAELHTGFEFPEQRDTVYWLKIVALADPTGDPTSLPPRWGWHDRDYAMMDPLASPGVAPGEFIEGYVGSAVTPTPVWHFQDDAVTGNVTIIPGPVPGGGLTVLQDPLTFQPTKYLDDIDGPVGIGQYSKDLAFELYTVAVPEPASIGLACLGMMFVGICALRRRRSDSQVGPAGAQAARRTAAGDQGGAGSAGPAPRGGLVVTQWRGGRTIFSLAGGAAICLAALVSTVAWPTAASALTTGNLLTDPGWETPLTNALDTYINVFNGPIYNTWGVEAGAVVGSELGVTPAAGSNMLRENLTSLVASQTFQIVDVSTYSSAINAGNATADFRALFNVPDVLAGAVSNVALTFRDNTNTQLGPILITSSSTLGGLDGNPNTWEPLAITGAAIPVNTVRINAEVAYSNASLMTSFPGYVDQADLRLNIVPEPAGIVLLGFALPLVASPAVRTSTAARS